MLRVLTALALVASSTAFAATTLEGERLTVHYDDEGQWGFDGAGFQIWRPGDDLLDGEWVDASWPGVPWNQVTIAWNDLSVGLNQGPDDVVFEERDLSDGGTLEVAHMWALEGLNVTKTESFGADDGTVVVTFMAENTGPSPIEGFRVAHGVDWDQEGFATLNDVRDDGWLATSSGGVTGLTTAYGVCDPSAQAVGFTDWNEGADLELADNDGEAGDITMHLTYAHPYAIAPGETITFRFLVLTGADAEMVNDDYEGSAGMLCGNMLLTPADPGVAGELNTFRAIGARPGARVMMLIGSPGRMEIPGCPGTEVAVASPKLVGPFTADGDGVVTFDTVVPEGVAGGTFRLQMAERDYCTTSNPVDQTF